MPLVSSNLWAARMRPRLPSLIRSASDTPWFWYFLATETTKRRLLRTSLSSASASPMRMRCASVTSSSCGISGYLLISRRYWSSDPSSNEGPRLPEPTCIGRMRFDLWAGLRIDGRLNLCEPYSAAIRTQPARCDRAASLIRHTRDSMLTTSYRVDLRALQPAGVVHVAHLGLRVELVDLPAALAVAVAGRLHAAERQMRLGADGRRVDVGDAVVELLHRAEREIHVARCRSSWRGRSARRCSPAPPRRTSRPGSRSAPGRRSPPAPAGCPARTPAKIVGR